MIAVHSLPLDIFMFLAGAGLVMTWTLWWWNRNQNGNRRVPHWIVTVQVIGWSMLLIRSAYFLYNFQATPPSWWLIGAVALMDAGQAGHLWAILRRNHHQGKETHA